MNAAARRLVDEDAAACQVQIFLDSVEPLSGNHISDGYCAGYAQVQRFVTHLAIEGDSVEPPLTPKQCSDVLSFLGFIQTREGKEGHAAGGSSNCGLNHVLRWLEGQVLAFQASEKQS